MNGDGKIRLYYAPRNDPNGSREEYRPLPNGWSEMTKEHQEAYLIFPIALAISSPVSGI